MSLSRLFAGAESPRLRARGGVAGLSLVVRAGAGRSRTSSGNWTCTWSWRRSRTSSKGMSPEDALRAARAALGKRAADPGGRPSSVALALARPACAGTCGAALAA